jgi:hypothetical protein
MTALAQDKARLRVGDAVSVADFAVAANTDIFAGALVSVVGSTGLAINAATATTHLVLGVATFRCDNNPGAASERRVQVETGVFEFANSTAGDAITVANVGQSCFVVDNDQVALTNGGSTRSRAGIIVGVTSTGVLVRVGFDMLNP